MRVVWKDAVVQEEEEEEEGEEEEAEYWGYV